MLDVGSNNGAFSHSIMQLAPDHVRMNFTLIEPQARFVQPLAKIVDFARTKPNMTARHVAAVAANHDRDMMFYTSKNHQAASAVESNALRYGVSSKARVQAVDLSHVLRDTWKAAAPPRHMLSSARRPVIFLKVDIEGGEAQLLPQLLVSGALCTVSYLRVEYHLNAQPDAQRLGLVALKHSLRSSIAHGCSESRYYKAFGPPADRGVVVESEEYRALPQRHRRTAPSSRRMQCPEMRL